MLMADTNNIHDAPGCKKARAHLIDLLAFHQEHRTLCVPRYIIGNAP